MFWLWLRERKEFSVWLTHFPETNHGDNLIVKNQFSALHFLIFIIVIPYVQVYNSQNKIHLQRSIIRHSTWCFIGLTSDQDIDCQTVTSCCTPSLLQVILNVLKGHATHFAIMFVVALYCFL